MNSLLSLAVRNNAELCAAVHRAHGHSSIWGNDLWTTAEPLRFYPNAITLTKRSQTSEAVARFLEERPRDSCGIKDSYAALDLTPWQFSPLIEAAWLARLGDPPKRSGPTASPIRDPEALAEWERAWGGDPLFCQFPPSLLTEPGFTFWGCREHGDIVSGCITNETGAVVGFSNVFGPPGQEVSSWHCTFDFLSTAFPRRPLVGWERNPDALAATSIRRLGPLTVWIRSPG